MSQDQSSSIGKTMIVLGWILFLALLTLLFSDFLEQQQNPNQTPLGASDDTTHRVELKMNRYGHYVSSGLINGQPVVFLLDTGATSVSIPEPVANRLGLERGLVNEVNTANGSITVYSTTLSRVALGPIELRDIRAHINPHMGGDEILLGMSFLKQLAFSQENDILTLTQYR